MSPGPFGTEPPARAGSRRTSVFLPKEHGSWSLALEPLALGLLVVPSIGGVALALAAFSGFLARRPVRALLGEARTPAATIAAVALLGLCAAAGFAEAAVLGGVIRLWPLLFSLPAVILFLYADWRGTARAALAEIAGGAAFALLPAALASLGGWRPAAALSLAAVMASRSVPTVMAVRSAVRSGKGQPASPRMSVFAAVTACVLLALLSSRSWVPGLVVDLSFLLVLRACFMAQSGGQARSARQLGLTEAVLGAVYVVGSALAYRF